MHGTTRHPETVGLVAAWLLAGPALAGQVTGATSDGDPIADARLAMLDDVLIGDPEPWLRNERGLEIELVTGAWLARAGGDVELGDGNGLFRIDQAIRNDDLEPTPLAELSFLDDEGFVAWRLHGFDFSSDASGSVIEGFTFGSLVFATGDPYRSSLDLSSAGIEHVIHRWTAIDPAGSDGPGLGRDDARLDFSFIGGLRWVAVDQEITAPGTGTEAPSADWFAAYGAARLEFTWAPAGGFVIGRTFRITGEYGFGPGLNRAGGSLWHVRAGAEVEFTDHVRGFFGYRLLELDLEDDDWTFDAGLQGLFVGATIQF